MEIREMNRRQQIALVATIEALTVADGAVSENEEEEIGRIAAELGEETYRELLDEAEALCPDHDALERCLDTIADQEARELIYGLATEEMMASPSIEHWKSDFMNRLAAKWNIVVANGG